MDCSYRAFFPCDDPLNYGLSTTMRSNVGVVVKMTDSSAWVIEVGARKNL